MVEQGTEDLGPGAAAEFLTVVVNFLPNKVAVSSLQVCVPLDPARVV
jgi:hypothetical protein